MTDKERSNFWPTATVENLEFRAELLQMTRGFFLERGFLEVDTPLLSRDTVVDCYIDPIRVEPSGLSNCPAEYWLQTSPEFAMKRLVAAGMNSIFQITRAFRNGESGDHHNPEFTILEWYQVGQSYADGRSMLCDLLTQTLNAPPATETTYAKAFEQHVGIDPHSCSLATLVSAARERRIAVPDSMNRTDRNEWLNILLAECVEPRLGIGQPTILYDYPVDQSALARIDRIATTPVAERFEAYVAGIEVANGYHELCDANELRKRTQGTTGNGSRTGGSRCPRRAIF